MKIKSLMLFMFVLFNSNTFAQLVKPHIFFKELLGHWSVKDHLKDDATIYTLQELKKFKRQGITFKLDSVNLFIDTLINPKYKIQKVSSKEYFRKTFQLTKDFFDIKSDSLLLVNIEGTVRLNNHRSYTTYYNFFFYDGRYLYLYEDMTIFRLYKPDLIKNKSK